MFLKGKGTVYKWTADGGFTSCQRLSVLKIIRRFFNLNVACYLQEIHDVSTCHLLHFQCLEKERVGRTRAEPWVPVPYAATSVQVWSTSSQFRKSSQRQGWHRPARKGWGWRTSIRTVITYKVESFCCNWEEKRRYLALQNSNKWVIAVYFWLWVGSWDVQRTPKHWIEQWQSRMVSSSDPDRNG